MAFVNEIQRFLQAITDETILMRIDPEAVFCPGCDRRYYQEHLIHKVLLLTGKLALCCDECADLRSCEDAGCIRGKACQHCGDDYDLNAYPLFLGSKLD